MNQINYQKELEKILEQITKTAVQENVRRDSQTLSAQLLCALQQLCIGVSVPIFFHYCILF